LPSKARWIVEPLSALLPRAALVVCAVALAPLSPALEALRAAGLNGVAPRGGGAFKSLIDQLTSNAEWLIITVIGLFLTAAAGALVFGVRSAPDWLFKAGAGLLLLMVGVPAVLA
jgi:hypothetical protein